MNIKLLLPVIFLILIYGCDRQDQQPDHPVDSQPVTDETNVKQTVDRSSEGQQEMIPVLALEFQETEMGTEPYTTSMFINSEYIRIDETGEGDGYVLFDRKHRRIYSVLHDSEKILVVDPLKSVTDMPEELRLREEKEIDPEAPKVGAASPVYYKFYANDTLCYHVIALEGFLPDAAQALHEFQSVLSAQQLDNIAATPKELQTPCYLANYVYGAALYMSKGFPFEQWDIEGYRRTLAHFEEKKMVNRLLFALPKDYQFFSLSSSGGPIM